VASSLTTAKTGLVPQASLVPEYQSSPYMRGFSPPLTPRSPRPVPRQRDKRACSARLRQAPPQLSGAAYNHKRSCSRVQAPSPADRWANMLSSFSNCCPVWPHTRSCESFRSSSSDSATADALPSRNGGHRSRYLVCRGQPELLGNFLDLEMCHLAPSDAVALTSIVQHAVEEFRHSWCTENWQH
jgi:hypothetical protein